MMLQERKELERYIYLIIAEQVQPEVKQWLEENAMLIREEKQHQN